MIQKVFWFSIMCLFPMSVFSANLLFQSGFEDNVAMAPMSQPNDRIATYQGIEGSDVPGYSWPIQLRSPTLSKFHHIIYPTGTPVPDLNDYFDTHIETVTGHDGLPTEALYQGLTQAAPTTTQTWYEIYYSPADEDSGSDEDTYIKYWMKLQDNLLDTMAAQEWRAFFELNTESVDYRVVGFIYRNPYVNGGSPYWSIKGEKFVGISEEGQYEYDLDWQALNLDVPVPIGEWFTMEYFWHRSTGDDGRFYWAVNGQVIADRYGPNYGVDNNPIDRIFPFGVYGSPIAFPIYQWIDDVEVWDGFPLAPLHPDLFEVR